MNLVNKKIRNEIEEILKEMYIENDNDPIQMFNCYSMITDSYITLYFKDDIEVRYCYNYEYIEVVGLNDKDYKYLFDKYGY